MIAKNANEIIKRCAILLAASFATAVLFLVAYDSVFHMADQVLIGIESEPTLGWDHWRWFFVKQNIGRVISALVIPIVLAVVVIWKWIAFARDIVRGRSLQRH
jgi:hypothetical protein